MDSEFWSAATTIVIVIIARIMSHYEHKKTGKELTEIRLTINGELEKKIKEAFNKGKESRE